MDLESERMGIIFQVFGIFWFLAAGIAQGVWDAIVAQWWLLAFPVFCASAGVFIWFLGRKARRDAREHHEFMQNHRRQMAGYDQRGKAIWS